MNISLRKIENSNILPSGKLPLPLTNYFKNCFSDKIDKIVRSFQNCQNSEEFFSIPDFPLMTIYVQAPVLIEQMFTFIKKINKTFSLNDAFDIKNFWFGTNGKNLLNIIATLLIGLLNPEFSLYVKTIILFRQYYKNTVIQML